MRTILASSEEHTARLAAVLDKLELAGAPDAASDESTPAADESALAATEARPGAPAPSSRSLELLSAELTATLFHQIQLRLIHARIKADATAVHHYGKLRTLVSQLAINSRTLQGRAPGGAQALHMRAALRRKENKILRTRMATARAFIVRLQILGMATPGHRQYDEQLAKWRKANQELITKGQVKEGDEDEGWEPEDQAAGKAHIAQAA